MPYGGPLRDRGWTPLWWVVIGSRSTKSRVHVFKPAHGQQFERVVLPLDRDIAIVVVGRSAAGGRPAASAKYDAPTRQCAAQVSPRLVIAA
jgi:hypothetical protein